jgi:hypothetical protein
LIWRDIDASFLYDKTVVKPIRVALQKYCGWSFAHELTAPFEKMLQELETDTLTLESYLKGLTAIFEEQPDDLPEGKTERLNWIKPFLQHLNKYNDIQFFDIEEIFLDINFAVAEDGTINKVRELHYFDKLHFDALSPWSDEGERFAVNWQNLVPDEFQNALPSADIANFLDLICETTSKDVLVHCKNGWQPKKLFQLLQQKGLDWEKIKTLPIFPTEGNKEFCTGNEIVRLGNFPDPFKVKKTLSKEISIEFSQWLDKLKLPRLEPKDYYSKLLPDYFDECPDDQTKQEVIQFLAEKFQEAKPYLGIWKNKKIIFCANQKWQTPNNLFFRNDLMDDIFGDSYSWVEEIFAETIEIKTLYEYLGVQREAKDIDIVKWLERHEKQPVTESAIEIRRKILEHISEKAQKGKSFDEILRLSNLSWLPDNTNNPRWHSSKDLYNKFCYDHIRYTLPNGKAFCRFEIPSPLVEIFKMAVPTIEMVIRHLEIMDSRGEKITESSLKLLENHHELLINCVERLQKLRLISNHLRNQFFINDPKLGNWRFVYPPKYKEQFPNITKLLDIKDKPQRDDFIAVLLEIAEKFDDLKADKKEALRVIDDCLEKLAAIYGEEQKKPESSLAWVQKIIGQKIIPHKGALVKANTVAIRDLGKDAIKRYELDDVEHLLVQLRGDSGFYEHLGVKSLKACLELEFVQAKEEKPNSGLQQILHEKKSLIIRVILHEKKHSLKETIRLYDELKAFTSSQILIRRIVRIQEQPIVKTLQFEFAYNKRLKRLMVCTPNLESLQGAIAEAFEIKDGGAKFNLETILESQKTIQEDHKKLDRLEISPLPEEFQLALIPSPTLETIDIQVASTLVGTVAQKVAEPPSHLPAISSSQSPQPQQRPSLFEQNSPTSRNLGAALTESPSDKSKEPPSILSTSSLSKKPKTNQRQERFKSYVYAEREKQDHEQPRESTTQETDKRGMKLAMDYEVGQGRIPDSSPARDKGCGYDIRSTSVNGTEERLIELKTTGSLWRERGVTMTSNEFQKAMRLGSKYWLYVIEDLDGQPRLYQIQNLEDKIQSIAFDGSWKEIAELDDNSSR